MATERVKSFESRFDRQELAMEKEHERRRRVAALAEERRKLRQEDRQENVARMMRRKEHEAAEMVTCSAIPTSRRGSNRAASGERERLLQASCVERSVLVLTPVALS